MHQQNQFGIPLVSTGIPPSHPGATGHRYYTIQRVNGNGGNGKGDGVAGPHKHTLAESDRVKKNSVQRFLMKKDKEEKKTQVGSLTLPYSVPNTGRAIYFAQTMIEQQGSSAPGMGQASDNLNSSYIQRQFVFILGNR